MDPTDETGLCTALCTSADGSGPMDQLGTSSIHAIKARRRYGRYPGRVSSSRRWSGSLTLRTAQRDTTLNRAFSTPSDPTDRPMDSPRGSPGEPAAQGDERDTFLFTLAWDLGAIGGVSQVVRALMEQMAASGPMRPLLAVNSWADVAPRRERADGLDRAFLRVRSPMRRSGLSLAGALRYLAVLPGHLRAIRAFTRQERVRVVNAHFPSLDLLTWFLARSFGGPAYTIVISLHGLEIRSTFGRSGPTRWLWSRMLRKADHVIACSDGLRDEVTREYQLPVGTVTTIHNGIDVERITAALAVSPPQTPPPAPRPRPYLCSVGTFEHKKAHDVLLRAFQLIAEQEDTLDLVMIGRAGETSASTRALVDELGLAERVRMIENLPHPQTLALMDACEAFVLASRVESFAIVLLEAGALAKPVVATDICGVGELIEDGVNGALVPAEDPEALAARVLELMAATEPRESLGRALRAHVAEHFRWSAAAAQYLALAHR